MEQEFDVEIKEVLSRVQKVKAESLDDAINKAMDMYYAEQIVLGAEDMKGVDFAPMWNITTRHSIISVCVSMTEATYSFRE